MADTVVEPSSEQAPAEEVLDNSTPRRKQSVTSVSSNQTKDGHRQVPVSPRRNGLPPKRTTATTKRPLNSAPTPATGATASSMARTSSGSSLGKPSTRPTSGTVPRRPAHAVNAATAASAGHKPRPSTSSTEEKTKTRSGSIDNGQKFANKGTAKRASIAPSASARAPALKSSLPPATKRVSTGPSTTSEKKPTTTRSAISGPAKSAVKSSTNATVRPTTSSNAARAARPSASSTNTVKDGRIAEAAKKRLSAIPPSQAPIQMASSSSTPAVPKRPGLPARQSTLSVTIQQRLREMQMVHQMLSAAMAEDDSGTDEDKQKAAKQADESIAMLKAKLEKARAEEGNPEQEPGDGRVDQGRDSNDRKTEGDDSAEIRDEDKEHQDENVAQLKAQLAKGEADKEHQDENVAQLKAQLTKSEADKEHQDENVAQLKAQLAKSEADKEHQDENVAQLEAQLTKSEADKEHQDKNVAQLKARSTKSEAKISELEADLQAEMLESSKIKHSIPKKVQEATESLRQEHKSEIDDVNRKYQGALDALRTKLEEMLASHGKLVEQHTKDLEAARRLATKEAHKEAAKTAEQVESIHVEALQDLGERLADEKQQRLKARNKMGELTLELEALKGENTELMDIQASLTKEMANMENGHAKELEDNARALESQHSKSTMDAEAAAAERLSEAEANHSRDLEKLVNEHRETYSHLRTELEEDKATEVTKAQKGHDAAMDEMRATVTELKKDLDMARNLEGQHLKSMKDAEAAVAERLSEAEAQHSKDIEKLVNEHQETCSRLRKELEEDKVKEVAKAQKEHDTAMEEMRVNVTELRRAFHQEEMAANRSEVEARKAHEAALEEFSQASEKAIAELHGTHEAMLEELRVELHQAKAAAVTIEEELEALRKAPPKIDEEEAPQLKKDLESARTELQQTSEKLTEALEDVERLKAQHDEVLKEIETVKSHDAERLKAQHDEVLKEIETVKTHDAELKTQLDELQKAVDAANTENTTLTEQLRRAENAAERHALKLREMEAAYKVTSAELTEMKTSRTSGADYCASPTPKSGLPLSKWADTSDVKDEQGKEGEELASSIEGTVGGPFNSRSSEYMAGLQEQVRQLEELNEDMLEETTRIVKMLSDVPLVRASREKGSEEES